MKKTVSILITLFIIVAVVFYLKKNESTINQPSVTKTEGKYCGPDGKLTDTMPIQSHRSYCIKSDASNRTYVSNIQQEYSFSLVDDQGNTLKDFAITHTKPMHVIVVRKDLATFEHVHPEYNSSNGWFTLRGLTFRADGQYRIFADFAPAGGFKDPTGQPLPVTVFEDVTVGSAFNKQPLGSEEKSKTFNGNTVVLETDNLLSERESMLTFTIYENDALVNDLEEYLGALGHSVILKEDSLDFIHAHPVEAEKEKGIVSFMVNFPEAGKYKIFTQFQRDGTVFATDFVVSVADGSQIPDTREPMQHSLLH